MTGLIIGLAAGLAAGLGAGVYFGPLYGFEATVVFGLGSGLAIWIVASRAPLVKLTELLLLLQGKGPVTS